MVNDPKQFDEMAHVASLFDTPFVFIYSSEMASGLLTDQAEALGKVTIGGEFGHSKGVSLDGVRHAYEGIRNVLRHYGMLGGEIRRVAPERPNPPRLVSAIHLDEYVPAPIRGYFEPVLDVGAKVDAGDLVGRLWDFDRLDAPPIDVTAPRAGYVILESFQVPIEKGQTMLVIGQEVKR